MPTFSLIIPVYKVEKWLPRCLDSVLAQTYSDYECILIDDGSPDQSGKICDMYAKKDNRFRVIHQANQGVSAARNVGLDIATGEYIAFCDSDDELMPNYLEAMVYSTADVVVSGIRNLDPNNRVQHELVYHEQYISKIDWRIIEQLSKNKAIFCIYAKRFRREIISKNRIRFQVDLCLGEDTLFFAAYCTSCNDLEYCSNVGYVYRKYEEQTLSTLNIQYTHKALRQCEFLEQILFNRYGMCAVELVAQHRWDAIERVLFDTVRSTNLAMKEKYSTVRELVQLPCFAKLIQDIDVRMPNDSEKIKTIIKTKNPFIILYGLSLANWIGRVKARRRGNNAKA